MRLACLLTWSGSGTSGEPTARGVSTWCSRSVHVVHVVADQEHSDCMVPVQDGTGMEICNANCACVNRWIRRKGLNYEAAKVEWPRWNVGAASRHLHRAHTTKPLMSVHKIDLLL